MDSVDVVVIGAGVVGLAVARAVAQAGREVVILEAADAFGTVTSARNSEVIHAGIYYPAGSLKAQACVRGKALLHEFLATRGVAHRRCGKLLVATSPAQHAKLEALADQARANGVEDLQPLTPDQARALEPALHCTAALLSPSTGIVDSHGLMLALLGDAERAGAMLALCSPVEGGECLPDGRTRLRVGGEQPMDLVATLVINAAGLDAIPLARRLEGTDTSAWPVPGWCKGSYFACAGRPAFSRLIYPMPEAAGLGVHVTLDLGGQMRFGPDTEWLPDPQGTPLDYVVDGARVAGMADAIRRYWPGLPDDALSPAYAGVRPKLGGPNDPTADFLLIGPEDPRGTPGQIHLLGIESPGLTSCLALAERVLALAPA